MRTNPGKINLPVDRAAFLATAVFLIGIVSGCAAGPDEHNVGRWRYVADDSSDLRGEIRFTKNGYALTFYNFDRRSDGTPEPTPRRILEQSYQVTGESVVIDDKTYDLQFEGHNRLVLRDADGNRAKYERIRH